MKKKIEKRKLHVDMTTVKSLTPREIASVVGGAPNSYKVSGCCVDG